MTSPRMLYHDWFPAPVPANVVIGERSWLYSSFSFLHSRSHRGQQVVIGHDSGIYHPSFFDLGEDAEVQIGNFCALVGVTISVNSRVVIGDYSFLAHDVVIADSFAATPAPTGKSAPIIIESNAWIAARAVLLGGAHIGEGSIVGAFAVVDFTVPPYSIVAGNPARVVGEVARS